MSAALLVLSCALHCGAPPDTADAPRAETIRFKGRAEVDVAPVWRETYPRQVSRIRLEPQKKPDTWTLNFSSDGYACSVDGHGPREKIVIRAGQTCRVDISQPKLRGTATVVFKQGSLTRLKSGVDQLSVSARVDANAKQRVQKTVFGQSVDFWAPLPIPEGRARYTATSTKT